MNRPQVVYCPSGQLVYFQSGARTTAPAVTEFWTDELARLNNAIKLARSERIKNDAFRRKIEVGREPDFRLANRYAAVLKYSIFCIQLVSGFHLGQIWATILRSVIAA